MTYVLQLAHDEHFELTPSLLRSLHFMMTDYDLKSSPGLWRPGPIWVRNEATGEVVYEAPDNDLISGLIGELIKALAGTPDCPPMVRGAMAHLNFVMIHPFRDGNGRMSRCLQTLMLAREQILSPEWMSIEEFLGANTCPRAHFIQAASVLRRARESEGIWVAVEELREGKGLPERATASLFDATIGLRNASHRDVELAELEEISNQVATNDLRKMVDARLLYQRGSKRGPSTSAPSCWRRQAASSRRSPADRRNLVVHGRLTPEPDARFFGSRSRRSTST